MHTTPNRPGKNLCSFDSSDGLLLSFQKPLPLLMPATSSIILEETLARCRIISAVLGPISSMDNLFCRKKYSGMVATPTRASRQFTYKHKNKQHQRRPNAIEHINRRMGHYCMNCLRIVLHSFRILPESVWLNHASGTRLNDLQFVDV